MRNTILGLGFALALGAGAAGPAHAIVHYGNPAPDFMKTQYNTAPAVSQNVNSYAFKVRVFFLLGYN